MHLGSVYLIVRDFCRSIDFYEKLLGMRVSAKNAGRFAQFEFEGHNISIMNGYYDRDNPEKTVFKGERRADFDDTAAIADAPNTHKSVLNFRTEDLAAERERIKSLNISKNVTEVKYLCNACPYYYFQLDDPDGNITEVTGEYNAEVK